MLTVDNNSFEDWQDYFSKTFEKSSKFDRREIGKKNAVYEEEYVPKDKNDKTKIKISYFITDGTLVTCDFINPQTPGYNKLVENEFFYQYDFTPDKSYGAPGLEFIQINLDAIHRQMTEGLKGKEIKYFSGKKHMKSDVFLDSDKQEIPFTVYFDGSSFWSRLFSKIFGRQKDNNFDKQVIELKTIFGGLKNAH